MKDLAGVEDSDPGFSEIDVASVQHLNESAQRAVRTRRGAIREFPDRYVDLADYVQSQALSIPAGAVAMGIQQDLEQDSRVEWARVTLGPASTNGRATFKIEIKPVKGALVTVEVP